MGKNTHTTRKKKRRPAASRGKATKDDCDSLSVEELLAAAAVEMDSFQYEAAQRLCRAALSREPDNVCALETSAGLCLEAGDTEGARRCLGRAITLQPDTGHEKYMSMAQLMDGRHALQCYLKGIEILGRKIASLPEGAEDSTEASTRRKEGTEAQMATETGMESNNTTAKGEENTVVAGNENVSPVKAVAGCSRGSVSPASSGPQGGERARLVREASTAHCSVAELFMTDLCDEDEAEEQCRAAITAAMHTDPTNPEAPQHMASFLLIKQEVEAAKEYIGKSLEKWLPQHRAVREGKAEAGSFDPVEVCPLGYATRLTTARILIEVGDHAEAIEVLEGLVEEDEEVVDTWYLQGWSHYLQGEEQRKTAHYCLHRALKVHSETPSEDTQLVEHLEELMEELGPYTEKEEEGDNIEEELNRNSDDDDDDDDDNDGENNAMDIS